jgi:hypothetical protein
MPLHLLAAVSAPQQPGWQIIPTARQAVSVSPVELVLDGLEHLQVDDRFMLAGLEDDRLPDHVAPPAAVAGSNLAAVAYIVILALLRLTPVVRTRVLAAP